MSVVLQKYIADAGYASRRKAQELIKGGRVRVNGEIAKPGRRVSKEDSVEIGNQKIKPFSEKIYLMMNKPRGYVCTSRKFAKEKNVFDLLAGSNLPAKRLKIAGRLDKDSRGLLILTNDGEYVNKLTHPSHGSEKEYLARISGNYGRIDAEHATRKLKQGVDIGEGDGIVRAKEARYSGPLAGFSQPRSEQGQAEFRIVLAEGKKRQIRRMFKALGHEVADLKRIRIGKIKLGDLGEGKFRMLDNMPGI